MSFNKKFFTTGGIVASSEGACTADDLNPFTGEVADGGVALYSLDYDASDAGGNYDGTPTDVDFGVGGKTNYGARFNGSSSSIVVPNNILTTNDHSISMWFNLNDTNGIQTVIEFDYENRILFRAVSTDNNKAYIGNSGYFNHGLSFSAGQWYHLVITFSAGNPFKIYVNGVLSYTGGNTNVLAQSNDNIIGASNGSGANGVDGDIDQVRIFSSALTSDQVSTLYAETACVYDSTTDIVNYPTGTTPVAYYKMDNSSEDYVGSNDGTDTNIEYRFGRFGQAAVFSAGNTGIDTGTTLQSGNNSFSVSLWFNKDVISTNEGLFSTHSSNIAGTREGANLAVHSSKLLLQVFNSGTATGTFGTTVLANDQKWHHVVAVYDGSANTYKAYLNGNTSSADASLSSNISGHEATLKLGRYYQNEADANAFTGKIDQVRIYSTALDSDQIAELYNEKPEVDTSNFKTVLYEGNGGSQYISNVGFQPDLVWVKNRDTSGYYHNLYDSIRGATYRLFSNLPNAHDSNGVLSSFDANGFYLTGAGDANASGQSIIAWVWKGGGDAVNGTGSGVTNVSVSANTEAGFSIVKYTGSGAAGMTVGHGLTEAIPELVIIKNLDNTTNWQVFGGSLFTRMQLDQTGDDDLNLGLTITSTTIQTTQTSGQEGNSAWNANDDYIAYCWHSVSGYSKIGTYEGTNSTVTVSDVGFKPSFVMIKNIDDSADWVMLDNRRNTIDDRLNNWLRANDDAQETGAVSTAYITVNDNGFIVASATSLGTNADGDTYIYMAFK